MPQCCVICIAVISWLIFGIVIRHVSNAQSAGLENKNRCDSTRVEFIKTPCINCWQNRKVGCPSGSKKQTRGSGTRGCRYSIRVGESTRMAQGCSHTCNQVVVDRSCCLGYWGPECQSCPRDSNDLVCGGKGKCSEGMSGNGTCVCNGNLSGDLCEACNYDHFYGPTCQSTCACIHGFCDNGVDGTGKCSCFSGYGGKYCGQALSECSSLTCHEEASCLNITGVVKCHCGKGYVGDGDTCEEINPCLDNISLCHPQADCLHVGPDNFTCKCQPNFTGDGVWCAPIDPCQTDNGNCPTNSTICQYNGPNQSSCSCRSGFANYTVGYGCSIIDICGKYEKTTCDSVATCQTVYGNGTISTQCICPLGYLEHGNRCYSDLLTELDKLNQTGEFQNKLNMAIVFFQVAYKNLIFTPYPLTLFVPLDQAFVDTNPSTMNSSPVWKARARAHIVPGTIPISFLGSSAKTMYPLLGADYPIRALRPGATEDSDEDDDDAGYFGQLQFRGNTLGNIIVDGKWASNGIIYIVDTLFDLSNETQSKFADYNEKNVLQVLSDLGQFYDLAMKSYGFRKKLAKTSYSLFVPTDEALSSFGPERWKYINSPMGQSSLDILLEYHMFTEPTSTLALTRVNRIRNIGIISVNVSTEDGLIRVGDRNAKILTSEVSVSEGNILIYIINKILVPDIIRPMVNNICNATVLKYERGPCSNCALKICPPGGRLVQVSPNIIPLVITCVYKVEVASDSNDGSARLSLRTGCSKLCAVNVTKTTCCPGFYGRLCRSCPGPTHQSCNDHGICSDGEKGNGQCACSSGFRGFACSICSNLTKYGRDCDQDCNCLNGKCKNTVSSRGECKPGSCKEGWAGENCDRPVETCNNGTLSCKQHASCIRAINGSESCECDPGYKAYNDDVCTEYNPCTETLTRGGCDVNAFCLNMGAGNILCVCPPSYTGDGYTCIPIDPCTQPSRGGCSLNGQCIFTGPGANRCDCNFGYRGDGTVCEEINICTENNGNCDARATCSPTGPGTKKCECLDGYEGNGFVCRGNILQEIGIRSDLHRITEWAQKWSSIRQMFMNLNSGFTAFLPNNDAWFSMELSDFEFWITEQHLLYLLQYHIVPEKILARDLLLTRKGKNLQTELSTADIYVNDVTVDSNDYNVVLGTIENFTLPTLGKSFSKILVSNLATSDNGVIHIIDSVLLPPRDVVKDYPALSAIAQNATGTQLEKFQKFLSLLLFTGVMDQIEESHMSTPYTLFIAPDSSSNSPPNNVSHETLSTLQYHVISGKMIRASNIRSGQHENTMLGKGFKLTLVQRHGDILVNGQSVSVADIRTSTGIIHGLSERYLQPVKSRCDKKTTDYAKVSCIPCSYPIQCPESTQLISRTHCLYVRLVSGERKITVGCKLKCAEEILQPTCCSGFYGVGCEPCPGGISNVCFGFGKCNDGMKGNGTCTCNDNTKYAGVACETCTANRYGRDCENMCKCVNGICNSGVSGNGACTCTKGYRGTLCDQPIDSNNKCGGMCHTAANCVSPNGIHGTCVCVAGYEGNGTVCTPVNPCESPDKGGCSIHGICRYVKPGFHNCTCKAKFEGDGIYCSEVNPCLIPGRVVCDPNANCMHIGADESNCVCADNYEGDGKSCKEINPCDKNNGDCDINANCKYIGPGQRYCKCKDDYFGNGFNCQGTIHTYVISDPDLPWFGLMETIGSLVPSVLNGPNPMILFAPTLKAMLTVQKDILQSKEKATRLFLNHIVGCASNTKQQLKGGMFRTIAGSLLNVTSSGPSLFINDTTRIYGNGTSFWNGIVYKIDKPIIPDDLVQSSTNAGLFQIDRTTDLFNPGYLPSINSTTNLLDYNSNMLKQRGFTWIATLLNISGDLPLLQTEIHQQWTLFLPTDDAFHLMPPQKLRQIITDSTYASEYIRFHMIRESFFTPQNLATKDYLRTMQGSEITIECDADSSIVGQVKVNQAATVQGFRIFPIKTSTRIVPAAVYVIDKVLDPSSVGGRCDVVENVTMDTECKLHVESVKIECPEGMKQVSAMNNCDIPVRDSGVIHGYQISCAHFKVHPKCCRGYFGSVCHPCPGGAFIPCSGNGVCDQGVNGTGKCTCKQGFIGYACERCHEARYGRNCLSCQCTVHGSCNEGIQGDGTCYCDPAWTGDKCDKMKTNSSICNPPCHRNGYCIKSGTCLCKPGHIGDGVESCTFSAFCKINNGGCSPYATCSIVGDSAACKCKANFVGDGYVCEGYDPCTISMTGCHKEARCVYIAANTSRCECNLGFQGDGIHSCKRTSNKISTCAVNNGGCSGHAICVDVPPKTEDGYPSTVCTCKVEYRGDGYVCHGTVWEVISESLEMRAFYKILQTQYRLQRKLNNRLFHITMFVPKNVKTSLLHALYLGFQRHFVIGNVYYYKDLLKMSAIKMKSGEFLRIENVTSSLFINGARIQKYDILATNGVIHLVDDIITKKIAQIPTEPAMASVTTPFSITSSTTSEATSASTKGKFSLNTTKMLTSQASTVKHSIIDGGGVGPTINVDAKSTGQVTTASHPFSRKITKQTLNDRRHSNGVKIGVSVLIITLILVGAGTLYWWKNRHRYSFRPFTERQRLTSTSDPAEEDTFSGLNNPAYDSTGFNTADNDDIILNDADIDVAMPLNDGANTEGFSFEE